MSVKNIFILGCFITVSLFFFFSNFNVYASSVTAPSQSTTSRSKNTQTLDFGADIIEGELKKPQLIMELGANVEDVSSIIHLRDNFNDFHAVDSKKRLRFILK
jgi:hypothetical protein